MFTLPLEEAEKQWLVGFATTVHKSQGSEAETVILPIWTQPKTKIWDRTLLYTAFTRSKKQVVIISNEEWLEKTVKLKGNYRLSRLPILYRAKVKKTND